MGDEADKAQGVEEHLRAVALANRRPEAPKVGGVCLNCEADIAPERRWCNSDCRDDWERFNP